MWIPFAFAAHQVYVNLIRIQTESSVKRPKETQKDACAVHAAWVPNHKAAYTIQC